MVSISFRTCLEKYLYYIISLFRFLYLNLFTFFDLNSLISISLPTVFYINVVSKWLDLNFFQQNMRNVFI